jgi:signal transduction histidine kinase
MGQCSPQIPEADWISELPSPPQVLLKLLELCESEEVAFRELADLLAKDTALSVRVMTLAGAARFGSGRKAAALDRMLVLLGFDTVKSLVMSAAIYQVFSDRPFPAGLDQQRFWLHSLACAMNARRLAKEFTSLAADEAYLAGLLHDAGKLLLYRRDGNGGPSMEAPDIARLAFEQTRYGCTHPEAGAALVSSWGLASFIGDAVLYHHETAERLADAHALVKLVHLANLLSQETVPADRLEAAARLVGISVEQARAIGAENGGQALEVVRALGMGAGGVDAAKRLAQKVRDQALLGVLPVRTANPTDLGAILGAMADACCMLFGTRPPGFFLRDDAANALHGVGIPGQAPLLAELVVSLQSEVSLVARALHSLKPVDSFQAGPLAIVDEQLIRLSGQPGILCLPMVCRRSPVGVMVVGLDEPVLESLRGRLPFLALFARQVAEFVQGAQQRGMHEAAEETRRRALLHEANNPLGIIKNYVSLLRLNLAENDPARHDLQVMGDEIERVKAILAGLAPGRHDHADTVPAPVDVNELVRGMTGLAAASFSGPDTRIETALGPGLPTLRLHQEKLKQVLLNLIKNAIEAMPRGGTLRITTQGCLDEDGARQVEILVEDNGPGIPAPVMAHLFQPVTSTKGAGHGVGLSVVRQIVKELGGAIHCRSTPGAGTTFTLRFPAAEGEEAWRKET